MKCPSCRSNDRRVIDSRYTETGKTRRSECNKCKTRWKTVEVDEAALEKMKKISMRQEFMEIAQSELNKAYFRMMEKLKQLAIVESAADHDEDGPFVAPEVVSFTDRRLKKVQ